MPACGWSGAGRLPLRGDVFAGFSEFAESGLASGLHETLIARTMDNLVEHSRDATAIEAREKPAPKPKAAKPKVGGASGGGPQGRGAATQAGWNGN